MRKIAGMSRARCAGGRLFDDAKIVSSFRVTPEFRVEIACQQQEHWISRVLSSERLGD